MRGWRRALPRQGLDAAPDLNNLVAMRHPDNLPPLHARPPRPRRKLGGLRASFLAGLAVMLPIAMTIWVFWSLTGWIDSWVMPIVPMRWHPDRWLGVNPRGAGVIIFLVFTVLVGWITKVWIGRAALRTGERLVDRMPIVRSVYGGLKQISETLLTQGDEKFDRACLLEYPRKGLWGIGFIAGPSRGEISELGPQGSRHDGGVRADDAESHVGLSAVCARSRPDLS